MIKISYPFDTNKNSKSVSQGPFVGTHKGDNFLGNAWDFVIPVGSKVLAVAPGKIVDIRNTVPDGTTDSALPDQDGDKNPLNDDQSLGSGAIGNIVTIEHFIDGTKFYSSYLHLAEGSVPFSSADVLSGNAVVLAGDEIGEVGRTGARTNPHLHFQVGLEATFFGSTNFGNWPAGSDNGRPQFIAKANEASKGLIEFSLTPSQVPSYVSGPGSTVFLGQPGNQLITGSSDTDAVNYLSFTSGVNGDLAANRVTGNGTDTLSSIEDLIGTNRNDQLYGDNGKNLLVGANGQDFIFGRGGNDILMDELGSSRSAQTWMDGGNGNDILAPGYGNHDVLTGGANRDLFFFDDPGGRYRIRDFEDGTDLIVVNVPNGQTPNLQIESFSGGTLITYDDWVMQLDGISPDQVTTDNFVFF